MTVPSRARVAVVVPSHNAAAYLAETLESVLAQTYQAWECIVVDDGSTDATADVARGFVARDSRFTFVAQDNAGVSAARNTALDLVADEVTSLAFLDSDDTWLPDALAVLVAALDAEGEDVVGVYGNAEYMDAGGAPLHPGAHTAVQSDRRTLGRFDLVDLPGGASTTWSSMIVSGTIWPPAVALHRRDAVESAGRFDPLQPYVEDWDLYLRMSRRGAFRPVARQVAWYRQHGTNLTKRAEAMAFYQSRLRWNVWRSPDNTAAQYREAQRVWRRLQLRWVLWAAQAAADGVRRRDREQARAAAGAAVLFGRQLAAGHPAAPDARTARHVTRFVTPRAAGRGAVDR